MRITSKKISALILAGVITICSFGITPVITNAQSTSTSITRAVTKTQTGTTTASVKMRSKSSTKGKVLATLKKGTKVEVIKKESNGWYKIKYKTKTGYVSGKYLKVTTTTSSTSTKTQTGTTTASTKMRSSSSTKGKVLETLKKGTKVEVIKKESNGWYKIKYKTKTGYISGKYLKVTTTSSNNSNTGGTSTQKPAVTGISFTDFKGRLSGMGFNSDGFYYENGIRMGGVRATSTKVGFTLQKEGTQFSSVIKNCFNLLLPTQGNRLYDIVSNPFSNQKLQMDGRTVEINSYPQGVSISIY